MDILRIAAAGLAVSASAPVMAQATPDTIAQSMITDLKAGNATTVIENLIEQAPLIAVGPSEKTNLINTLNTFLSSYGAVEGGQLIRSQEVAGRYVARRYMIFQEKYALNFNLKFYRGAAGWKLVAFSFNDKMDDILEAQSAETFEKSFGALAEEK